MIAVSDEDIQKALDYLMESAPKIGNAAAEVDKCRGMLKATKALAMKASGESSAAAQEREAYASEQYKAALQNEFQAVREFQTLKAYREAASARIDAWRSSSANQRAVKL